MCSDLQDPTELIIDFIREWEKGADVVCAVKPESKENVLMSLVRRSYYWLLAKFSQTEQILNFTGFGLYDRQFMEAIKLYQNPYPYFRGLVGEIGFRRAVVPFDQPARKRGRSKNNFFTLNHFWHWHKF